MAAEPPGMTDRLLDAMAGSAARRYGAERVSELAHALQCAELAREAGADEELTLACLLHDVGRFAVDQALIFDRVGGGRAGGRGHHSAKDVAVAFLRLHQLRTMRYDDPESAIRAVGRDLERRGYPLLLTPLDTSGEKPFEEFVAAGGNRSRKGISQLAVDRVSRYAGPFVAGFYA